MAGGSKAEEVVAEVVEEQEASSLIVTYAPSSIEANFDTLEKRVRKTVELYKGATYDLTKADKIKEAKVSHRLKTHPVCLTAGEGFSFEMEKYFKNFQMPEPIKAERILELNVDHPAVKAMAAALATDRDKAALYAKILYDQANLIAGLSLEDPSAYTDMVAQLMQ